jgi:hypothetical protein
MARNDEDVRCTFPNAAVRGNNRWFGGVGQCIKVTGSRRIEISNLARCWSMFFADSAFKYSFR